MKRSGLLLAVLFVLAFESAGTGLNQQLLVISFDGFRRLYLNNTLLPWFNYFAEGGVVADNMQSIFPSDTFPNHWAIVTGRYAESHGIVSNGFYDPKLDKTFEMQSLEEYWWNQAEPIWWTAQKQGKKRTSVSYWPGSAVIFDNSPAFYRPIYDPNVPYETLIDETVGYLSKEKVDLAFIYFDQPDSIGHDAGPGSDAVKFQLQKIDWYLSYLLLSLDKTKIGSDKLNIIVCADHGMVDITDRLWIEDYVDMNSIDVLPNEGAVMMIKPKPGTIEELMANLTKASAETGGLFTVYLKKDVPTEFHYSNNDRILDMVIICKPGAYMAKSRSSYNYTASHGFDPRETELQPLFMARGPAFKKGGYRTANMFETKDIYAMIAHIIGVMPAETNATLANVRDIFAVDPLLSVVDDNSVSDFNQATENGSRFSNTPCYLALIYSLVITLALRHIS